MDTENMVKENIDILFENLEKFLRTETVVGEPILIGETTLVPIVSVSFGCFTGAGLGSGNNPKSGGGSGSGSGLGSAARIMPAAVLVIQKGEVTMLPIKDRVGLSSLIEKVPDIMDRVGQMRKDQTGQKEPDAPSEAAEPSI